MEQPNIGQEPDYTVRAPIAQSIENIPFTPVQEGGMTDWNTYFSEENVNTYYKQLNAMVQAPLKFGMDVLGAAIKFKGWEREENIRLGIESQEVEEEKPNSDSWYADFRNTSLGASLEDTDLTFDTFDPLRYQLDHLGLTPDGIDVRDYDTDPLGNDPEDTIEPPQPVGPPAPSQPVGPLAPPQAKAVEVKARKISMSTPLSTYQWLAASAIGAVPNTPDEKVWVPGNETRKISKEDLLKGLIAAQPDITGKIGKIGQEKRIPISDLLEEGEELLKRPIWSEVDMPLGPNPEQPVDEKGELKWEGEEYKLYRKAEDEWHKQRNEAFVKYKEAKDKYEKQQAGIQFKWEKEITGHPKFQAATPLIPREHPTVTRNYLHSTMLDLTPEQFSSGPLEKQKNMYDGLPSNSKQIIDDYLGNPHNSNIKLHVAIVPTPPPGYTSNLGDDILYPNSQNQDLAPGSREMEMDVVNKTIGLSKWNVSGKHGLTIPEWNKRSDADIPVIVWEATTGPNGMYPSATTIANGLYPLPTQQVSKVNDERAVPISRSAVTGNDDGVALIVLMNLPETNQTRDMLDIVVHEGLHAAQGRLDFNVSDITGDPGDIRKKIPYMDRPHEKFAYLMGRIMTYRMNLGGDKARPLTDRELKMMNLKRSDGVIFTDTLSPEIQKYLKNMVVSNQQPTEETNFNGGLV